MDINLVYEPDTAFAPAGFFTAMSFAAAQMDALLTDNVTITIDVGWDNAVLGEAGPENLQFFTYGEVVTALKTHADSPAAQEAANSMPALDPTNGNGVYLSVAQSEALGLYTGPSLLDGTATFGSGGTVLNFSTTNRAVNGEEDFVGVAEHELAHALGRSGWGDGATSGLYSLMDLYRFSSNGVVEANADPNSATSPPAYFSIDNGATSLASFSAFSDYYDWSTAVTADSFDALSYEGVANTISAVDQTLLAALGFDVACFCPGTRMATPGGERPIEDLRIGDEVISRERPKRIKWIGRSAYEGRFLGDNPLMLPVTFAPGALGAGLPARALTVSPGHGMCLGEVLVPAWRLVNGVSVTQTRQSGVVTYLHIELEQHGLLCSEGCWSESFYAEIPRSWFQNGADYAALYPGPEELGPPCLPRVEEGLMLQALQHHVNRQAGLAPVVEEAAALSGFVEEMAPGFCSGWAYAGAAPVTLLVMRGGEVLARIVANRYRADLRAAGLGQGCHGFAVALPEGASEIVVRRALDGSVLPRQEKLAAAA